MNTIEQLQKELEEKNNRIKQLEATLFWIYNQTTPMRDALLSAKQTIEQLHEQIFQKKMS